MEEQEIDHEFTNEIVCPNCGHIHTDCFEFPDSGTQKCDSCHKEFSFIREIEVTYSTSKLEP
jgi:DNA-directed RNA polymerase subunit RPC12/RpoP